MNFINSLEHNTNVTRTTNGAVARATTGSKLLDFFATAGALRSASETEILNKFGLAFAEDRVLATKMLFYSRDIRGAGLGERRVFKLILHWLAQTNAELVRVNISNIPFYGRFDDLFVLFGTPCERDALNFIRVQWMEDNENARAQRPISLLAKWLPSENASSIITKRYAYMVMTHLGLKPRAYRKTLSGLRTYIDVVEKKMSANQWGMIDYSAVPSYAMNRYRTAFYTHDLDGMTSFIGAVQSGEVKINSKTLFPYDIVEKYMSSLGPLRIVPSGWQVLEEQWKALPNYIEGEHNILVMADTSGSMIGRPMNTAIGLAMYFAERNTGAYHGKFMTFSSQPTLQTVHGATLGHRINNLQQADWEMNTDFERALDVILDTAVRTNASPEDMPKSLVCISDMQFDEARRQSRYSNKARKSSGEWTFYETMKAKYARAGYQIPNIVFWNVDNKKDAFQVSADCQGVQLVSGQSASTFKSVITGVGKTPYELMVETLSDEWYNRVVTI